MEGQVVATDDPNQMGRVRVWVPALDGESFDINMIPWAEYASPLAGFTVSYPAGGGGGYGDGSTKNYADVGYGFWSIPKIGASVLLFCMNGDPGSRFYFASIFRQHCNRSLPAGRNVDARFNVGPLGDIQDVDGNSLPIQPAWSNLREQFANRVFETQSLTRGLYERQVAEGVLDKTGQEGYGPNPADSTYLDPQTSCWVTPGRHAIIFQDNPQCSRLRLKTAEGHQVIFDDANERIYVSTAKGRTWIEMDQDGHINIFGQDSISIRSGSDINIKADRDINMHAGRAINAAAAGGSIKLGASGDINISAGGGILQSAGCGIDLDSKATVSISAQSDLSLLARQSALLTGLSSVELKGGALKLAGSRVDINSGDVKSATAAGCASAPDVPPIIPDHEPWVRPSGSTTRGPNWKA